MAELCVKFLAGILPNSKRNFLVMVCKYEGCDVTLNRTNDD